jgi:hypothetical protein
VWAGRLTHAGCVAGHSHLYAHTVVARGRGVTISHLTRHGKAAGPMYQINLQVDWTLLDL